MLKNFNPCRQENCFFDDPTVNTCAAFVNIQKHFNRRLSFSIVPEKKKVTLPLLLPLCYAKFCLKNANRIEICKVKLNTEKRTM